MRPILWWLIPSVVLMLDPFTTPAHSSSAAASAQASSPASQPLDEVDENGETKNERHIRMLMSGDRYKEALEFIDAQASALGASADFFRGKVFASAEKRSHGFAADAGKAVSLFKKAVEAGHGGAAVELANMYKYGEGVPESEEQAVFWLRKAANLGDPVGQLQLANFYYDNENLPGASEIVNVLEALSKDDTLGGTALLKLGRVYCRGKCGVAAHPAKGIAYLEKAAELGNKNALMDLAHFYYAGKHVQKDLKRALQLAEKAGPDHLLYDEVIEKIQEALKSTPQ